MIVAALPFRIELLFALIIAAGICAFMAERRGWCLSLPGALLLALSARIATAILARPETPFDVARTFLVVATEISELRDPTLSLSGHQWNFLPPMAYLFWAISKIDLPWVDVVKAFPILCDVLNVWLVGILSPVAFSARRRIVYALHPIALITTAVHGQIEPIALTMLLAGVIFYRRNKDMSAGFAFGFAIATKTWPILAIIPVVLRSPKRLLSIALAGGFVVGLFFLSSVVLLGSSASALAKALASYGSFAGLWGWAGTLHNFGYTSIWGYDTFVSRPGTLLVIAALLVSLAVFRNASILRQTWTALTAALVVTAGFGPQYLMWPIPMLTADGENQIFYSISATAWMMTFYLNSSQVDVEQAFLAGLSWVVIAAMVQMLWRAKRENTGELSVV